jgi:hypothetical protein
MPSPKGVRTPYPRLDSLQGWPYLPVILRHQDRVGAPPIAILACHELATEQIEPRADRQFGPLGQSLRGGSRRPALCLGCFAECDCAASAKAGLTGVDICRYLIRPFSAVILLAYFIGSPRRHRRQIHQARASLARFFTVFYWRAAPAFS